MSTRLSSEQIEKTIAFHGHMCPGLAWGMRVAEVALRELGQRPQDEELVAVAQTDNCAVDAIQYLLGCTLGKGNLRVLDHGQNVFTIVRRSDGRALRVRRAESYSEQAPISPADAAPEALAAATRARAHALLGAKEADLLVIEELASYPVPERAEEMASLPCARCGVATMASRLVRYRGQSLCIRCVEAVSAES